MSLEKSRPKYRTTHFWQSSYIKIVQNSPK
jgi:hypothetical protein